MQAQTFSVILMNKPENILLKLFMNHALGETKKKWLLKIYTLINMVLETNLKL